VTKRLLCRAVQPLRPTRLDRGSQDDCNRSLSPPRSQRSNPCLNPAPFRVHSIFPNANSITITIPYPHMHINSSHLQPALQRSTYRKPRTPSLFVHAVQIYNPLNAHSVCSRMRGYLKSRSLHGDCQIVLREGLVIVSSAHRLVEPIWKAIRLPGLSCLWMCYGWFFSRLDS
jgi:hypothetical protein